MIIGTSEELDIECEFGAVESSLQLGNAHGDDSKQYKVVPTVTAAAVIQDNGSSHDLAQIFFQLDFASVGCYRNTCLQNVSKFLLFPIR